MGRPHVCVGIVAYSVISVYTESTVIRELRYGTNECGARVHTSLGRNGQPMGREPHRGAGARATVPFGGADHRRGHRGRTLRSTLQREHQPAGAAELAAGTGD